MFVIVYYIFTIAALNQILSGNLSHRTNGVQPKIRPNFPVGPPFPPCCPFFMFFLHLRQVHFTQT